MQKNTNRSISITLNKTRVQLDQLPQHKIIYTEPNQSEMRNNLRFIGIENKLLNITAIALPLKTIMEPHETEKLLKDNRQNL